jgi:protein-disulfide isomerase
MILSFVTAFAVPFITIIILMPALQKAKENKRIKNELQRLKHNPQIFEALLAKQKTINVLNNDIGITLGNQNAKYKLIKVCNPYCGPCAKAHAPMEELLENNSDVQVQIIFTATNEDSDRTALPVKHLMAIAEKNNKDIIKHALDDWYLADKKDYEVFAAKYPMNGELQRQGSKIEAMNNWCNEIGISFTPTFFVNGYELPEIYDVTDLKYFLST